MERHVGLIIKEIRKSKKLTLDQISQASGVSKSMLSQIESGKTNPTLAMLIKISQGIQVPTQDIVGSLERPESNMNLQSLTASTSETYSLLGNKQSKLFKRSYQNPKILDIDIPGVHFSVLTPLNMVQILEVYQILFSPSAVLASKGHGKSVTELITILEGEFLVETKDGNITLKTGDFAFYPANDLHVIKNQTNKPGKVHLIVQYT